MNLASAGAGRTRAARAALVLMGFDELMMWSPERGSSPVIVAGSARARAKCGRFLCADDPRDRRPAAGRDTACLYRVDQQSSPPGSRQGGRQQDRPGLRPRRSRGPTRYARLVRTRTSCLLRFPSTSPKLVTKRARGFFDFVCAIVVGARRSLQAPGSS
jgi:hypothetical protein